MPETARRADDQPAPDRQLRVVQEALLALLASKPSYGYELRARVAQTLGTLARGLNDGQIYVTLARLERARLLSARRMRQRDRPDRKVYELTESGRERVRDWLQDTSWSVPVPAEFHLKLVAAAAARLADPVAMVDAQRRELLLSIGATQRAALDEPPGSVSALLLEGVVLRLQADLRWLDSCAQYWSHP